jgi:hypothetical protein
MGLVCWKQVSHVLNVLHPGTKDGNAYDCLRLAYARTGFAYAHRHCLMRSLRWLTSTTVLLTSHPYLDGPWS